MECRKCNGLVVKEWLSDGLDEAYVWRCLNCGSLTDEIIQKNQHWERACLRASAGPAQWGVGRVRQTLRAGG